MESLADGEDAEMGQQDMVSNRDVLSDQLALLVSGVLEQKTQIEMLSKAVTELARAQDDTAPTANLAAVEVDRGSKQLQQGQEQLRDATKMKAIDVERNVEEQQVQAPNLRHIADATEFVNSRVEESQMRHSIEVEALREEISKNMPMAGGSLDNSPILGHRQRVNDRRMSDPLVFRR